MMSFVFRLQVVLDRALRQEEEECLRLARLQDAQAVKEAAVAAKQAARRTLCADLDTLQQGTFDAQRLHDGHLQRDALGNEEASLRAELNEIDALVAQQQRVVAEAMRKREMLEKLRDQQREAHDREAARKDYQQMEETVLPRLARERMAEARDG
jgi:flagellar export protein FliJ